MNIGIFGMVVVAVCWTAVVMTLTWWCGRRLRNYGVVDAVWSFLFAPVAWWYAVAGEGWEARRWLVAGVATFWSLRLGGYLARRIVRAHPEEDVRYAELRVRWGGAGDRRMLGFFWLQGLLVVGLATPFLLGTQNATTHWASTEVIALAVLLLALIGEAVADAQLAAAKRRGLVLCQQGLWRYSRHPNYFFEWLVWVAFALLAHSAPWGWLGWVSPLLMLHFLLNVTGIPLTEELAVRRKGDAYREYQRTTSAFVPWFRKEA